MLFYYPHSSEYAILAMIKPNFFLSIIALAIISAIVLFTTKNVFLAVCTFIIVFFTIRAFKK
ncbi:hypothetical protein [Campylobacter ureolyticus]|uniref:hypothetical protein n=1 Tax=Campylobacter ureolyticus TaxID=827 RepID=UPI000366BDB2|nr:hypothetical protein [Campylobacter ureolyticus]MCR8685217.1 hypothetical protein [Campylobacter ureolyticus]QQY35285.1 hypothetical protein I6I59_07140 [Campylobacter ureolyticus]SUX22221.1 Uncharacterised protein [Campylobacter ureolyticus]